MLRITLFEDGQYAETRHAEPVEPEKDHAGVCSPPNSRRAEP